MKFIFFVIFVGLSSYCCLTRSIKDVGNNTSDNVDGSGTDNNGVNTSSTNNNDNQHTSKTVRNVKEVVEDNCDLLNCDNESDRDNVVVCAATNTGAVATFRSECGVKLLNCYQRLYTTDQYRIVSRKVCAHKSIWYLRGHCDRLICENNGHQYQLGGGDQQSPPPEKRVCATNGDSMALFKSACHVEVLNCYQKMYRKPTYRTVPSKYCGRITSSGSGYSSEKRQ